MTPEEKLAKNEELILAYRLTFNSPSGKIVLDDLMRFCRFRADATDQFEEGKRRAFLHIVKLMNLTDEHLLLLYANQLGDIE